MIKIAVRSLTMPRSNFDFLVLMPGLTVPMVILFSSSVMAPLVGASLSSNPLGVERRVWRSSLSMADGPLSSAKWSLRS